MAQRTAANKSEEVETGKMLDNHGTPPLEVIRYVKPEQDLMLTPIVDLAAAKQRLLELREFVASYLVEDEDYGTIPGTPKPTLFKSGADKLCDIYCMADNYRITNRVEDWDRNLFDYEIECTLTSKRNGQLVGTGLGSCNSYESKYRWRDAGKKCPHCQKEAIIKGKEEYGGGWVCYKKKGGCGATFRDDDKAITGQTVGRVQNDDIATLKNTILKMATKRAKVAAVLSATRSSALFSQDLDDIGADAVADANGHAAPKPVQTVSSAPVKTPSRGAIEQIPAERARSQGGADTTATATPSAETPAPAQGPTKAEMPDPATWIQSSPSAPTENKAAAATPPPSPSGPKFVASAGKFPERYKGIHDFLFTHNVPIHSEPLIGYLVFSVAPVLQGPFEIERYGKLDNRSAANGSKFNAALKSLPDRGERIALIEAKLSELGREAFIEWARALVEAAKARGLFR